MSEDYAIAALKRELARLGESVASNEAALAECDRETERLRAELAKHRKAREEVIAALDKMERGP